jgi:hypothetical protein
VKEGAVQTVDVSALKAEAQEVIDRIYAGMGARRKEFLAAREIMDRMEAAVHAELLPYSRYGAL